MKQSKKGMAAILAAAGVLCLTAAAAFGIHFWQENKRYQDALDSLRDAAESLKDSQEHPEASGPDPAGDSAGLAQDTPVPAETPDPPKQTAPAPSETPAASPAPAPQPTAVPVVNPYRDSFLANSDMAAWIQIPGTVIDYPVMWTPRDEEYYLYRDFNGRENKNGCLILDTDSSLDPLTTNLIIHGHNMKSGEMFGRLTDYEDPAYCEDHKNIILYTKDVQRNYEVISVFRSQVYKKSDQVFKYYKFFQADTEEEFDDFYQNIMDMSLYDTNVTAEFGDHFLTLSTCVYHVEQGRLVVVAKEVESTDTYLPIEE